MPNEVKQRKKTQPQKQNEELPETSNANARDETQKEKTVEAHKVASSSFLDLKTILCLLCLVVCGVLMRVILQQNERFLDIEKKYKHLHGTTENLLSMEERILHVSEKLAASEDDLQAALSTASLASRIQQDIGALHKVVMAMQADENSASHDLQAVNAHFLNVTDTWQGGLAAVTEDLTALKSESREAHAKATDDVNEAERRARALAERLEELEDSTRRNARALERTEEEDAKRAQDQLDWNTRQIHKLEEQVGRLAQKEAQLNSQLEEHVPRAKECEEHLPAVEEAVRSILRLAGDLSAAEKRLEEVTLQVFGTEDSMLKALTEILEIRQELDTLHAHNSILKMKNELSVVKEAVHELTMVLRSGLTDSLGDLSTSEAERWLGEENFVEEEEPLYEEEQEDPELEELLDEQQQEVPELVEPLYEQQQDDPELEELLDEQQQEVPELVEPLDEKQQENPELVEPLDEQEQENSELEVSSESAPEDDLDN